MDWTAGDIPLQPGVNQVTITVEDIKGLTTSHTLTVLQPGGAAVPAAPASGVFDGGVRPVPKPLGGPNPLPAGTGQPNEAGAPGTALPLIDRGECPPLMASVRRTDGVWEAFALSGVAGPEPADLDRLLS